MQFIPFVHAFYAFEAPLFYNHRNCAGNVIVIFPTMGTYQNDLLGGALFTLTHFKALCLQPVISLFVYFHPL
jgi:hypothetical protein